jgi:hypothetical protein
MTRIAASARLGRWFEGLSSLFPTSIPALGATRDKGCGMSDSDQSKEEEVLKRMLRTPHTKHGPTTPLGKRRRETKNGADSKADPA